MGDAGVQICIEYCFCYLIPAPSFFQEKTESYRHLWCWIHLHKSTLSFEPCFGLWQSSAELNPLKKNMEYTQTPPLCTMFCIKYILSLKCFSVKVVIHDTLRSACIHWAELSWLGRVCPLEKRPTYFLCVCVAGVETNDVQPHWDSWSEGKGSINEKDERLLVPDHGFSILRDCQIFHFQLGSVFSLKPSSGFFRQLAGKHGSFLKRALLHISLYVFICIS